MKLIQMYPPGYGIPTIHQPGPLPTFPSTHPHASKATKTWALSRHSNSRTPRVGCGRDAKSCDYPVTIQSAAQSSDPSAPLPLAIVIFWRLGLQLLLVSFALTMDQLAIGDVRLTNVTSITITTAWGLQSTAEDLSETIRLNSRSR
jgi:hypothetical protein